MTTHSGVETSSLLEELRLAVEYAARAGLLRDRTIIDALQAAERATQDQHAPDLGSLVVSINEVAQLISPMTLADLGQGRDPFTKGNQKRSNRIQIWLTLFSLFVLVLIGYFMHSLRVEQGAIAEVTEIQELQPVHKLTAVRKMAQYDEPLSKQSALYDEYHQRVEELRLINGRVVATYSNATAAAAIPLLPIPRFLVTPLTSQSPWSAVNGELTRSAPPEPNSSDALPERTQETEIDESSISRSANVDEFCAEDLNGDIRLPNEYSSIPGWMKKAFADSLSDFCFQLKVLSPAGDGALLNNQSIAYLSFVTEIKEKVSLRITWFLPFLYGLLGSAVFMMRNAANVRTPAMNVFAISMRLSLGGVAGIVVGWFSASASPAVESVSVLSVPFAVAFLTGYGIDALFSLLDKLNRIVGEIPRSGGS